MVADAYRHSLLATFGQAAGHVSTIDEPAAELDWARSGAMALTGLADGPPLLAPGPLAAAARGAHAALVQLARDLPFAEHRALARIDAPALLGERAAIARLSRRGTTSPGGACHLLRCADGWIAVNLAREEDVEMLPAWLGDSVAAASLHVGTALRDPRTALERAVRPLRVAPLLERAMLMGLPIAEAADRIVPPDTALRVAFVGGRKARARDARPRVLDLSSLWAGPLCTHLLGLAGARVIKVESERRPDGARRGPREFHDLLNAGKESVALDFDSVEGRAALVRLVGAADIVVESSRPRALRGLGVDAETLVRRTPGLVWVSITGYGRDERNGHRVAFGDDAAAAAGLATALALQAGTPVFCGDAVADPLTGLYAAAAALAAWRSDGGALVEVALRDVAAHAARGAALPATDPCQRARGRLERRTGGERSFEVVVDDERARVEPPRARSVTAPAAELGAHTAHVLAEPRSVAC